MSKSSGKPQDLLPLRPVDFLVLVVLLEGERHGYGMVQEISHRTGGEVRLVPGNFYAVLRRLMEAGLLEELDHRNAPDLEDQRRKYYGITEFGREVAAAEARRMRSLLQEREVKTLIKESA